MQDAKEEVRARLNIEDIIGEYVHLNRAGRNFKGLSPFSGEKTPSFFVSPDKQIWHDFSSNKGGDIFSFIMEVEGLDFRASLEHLARKAGVELAAYSTSSGSRELAERKKRLYQALDLAATYYQKSLVSNQHAIDYVFKKRRLAKQVVSDFKIGYAPDSGDALVQFLIKKGFSRKELDDAGLLNRFGGDLFRGRMSVPLMDGVGQVIGFTGRILIDDKKSPKYLNTPQTILYDKSRHVFGLSQAKEAIRKMDYSVIVEGNLDVVSSHQVGISQVVATAGTAMTEYHLKALVRLSNNVRLAFDGDKAGLAATERAIPIAQNVGVDLSIITLVGDAKDPDELIQQDPDLWQQSIDNSEPAIDWLLKQYAARDDLNSAAGKKRFTNAALMIIRSLNDVVEREHYLKKVAKYCNTSLDALNEKISQSTDDARQLKHINAPQVDTAHTHDGDVYQDNLLAVLLIDKAVQDLLKSVKFDMFVGEERQAVARYIAANPGQVISATPEELQKYDMYVKILLLKADARYAGWSDKDRYYETARLIRQVLNEYKQKQKIQLTKQLRDFESDGDDAKADEVRAKLNNLIKEMQNGQR